MEGGGRGGRGRKGKEGEGRRRKGKEGEGRDKTIEKYLVKTNRVRFLASSCAIKAMSLWKIHE